MTIYETGNHTSNRKSPKLHKPTISQKWKSKQLIKGHNMLLLRGGRNLVTSLLMNKLGYLSPEEIYYTRSSVVSIARKNISPADGTIFVKDFQRQSG